MLVSGIAQSGQNSALSRLAIKTFEPAVSQHIKRQELIMGSNSFSLYWEFSSGSPPCTENLDGLVCYFKI